MGFINKAKEKAKGAKDAVVGSDGSAADDLVEDFEPEEDDEEIFEDEGEEEFADEEIAEPEDVTEWEDAYEFAMEHLEEFFTSGAELAPKIMAYDIERSDLFRDRIQSGVSTIDAITDAKESLQSLKGESKDEDWKEKAEKLDAANQVIDSVDKLSGKEDEVVNEVLGVAKQGIEAYAKNNVGGGGGSDVDTSMTETDEEL